MSKIFKMMKEILSPMNLSCKEDTKTDIWWKNMSLANLKKILKCVLEDKKLPEKEAQRYKMHEE